MKTVLRHILTLISFLIMLICLVGCSRLDTPLLKLPRPPSNYIELQKKLDSILKDGTDFSAPIDGTNRNHIQFVDIDNDGVDEVLSFFRNTTKDGSSLTFCVHKKINGSYEVLATIDGAGDSFDAVWYPRLDTSGTRAVVIGWRLGTSPIRGVSIYRLIDGQLTGIYYGEYTGIAVTDMNGNDSDDILLLRHTSSASEGTATLLSYEIGELKSISTAPLSSGVTSPLRIRVTDIGYGNSAVVVESNIYEKSYVTDLLTFKNGVLSNLLYSDSSKSSMLTLRQMPIFSCDINKDGVTEIPRPKLLPGVNAEWAKDIHWNIDWCRYNHNLYLNHTMTTYLNIPDRWYLTIEPELVGNYTVDEGMSIDGVHSIRFYRWDRIYNKRGTFLYEIYKLTGEHRFTKLSELELLELARTNDTLYACRFGASDTDIETKLVNLGDSFQLIDNEWLYENWALPIE